MSEPGPLSDRDGRISQQVFISFASINSTEALKVCKAIEGRGIDCWISMRDVPPGANYQEAIVQSIRDARAMVLVFSKAANNSDEIKKELSLASRYRVPVMALRIEDVEPSDAFAYELSTRQWMDAFKDRDGSIDALTSRIQQLSGAEPGPTTRAAPAAATPTLPRPAIAWRRPVAIATAVCLILLMMAGAWWWLRPSPAATHSMTVRLAGFQLLSPDLHPTIRATVDAEIAAAFNADGVVGVSTASAPAPGSAPAYALGGTIQRDGQTIRVITHLTNERSGATVWGETFDYDGNEAARVPRHIAVDAGNVVRCGLFGASTYRKALPDAVLRDYMQFCRAHWNTSLGEGRKGLVPAERVVAALPDFSWGWAAVAAAYWKVAPSSDTSAAAEAARARGRQAADRALAIDSRNSEALYIKAMLIDQRDWLGRDRLFKQAVAARRLDCGCEHHQFGVMLANVGRIDDAVAELRQANDMLALYLYTPLSLADALIAAGKADEAKPFFDAAIQLSPDAAFADRVAVWKATETGDSEALLDPRLGVPPELRAALLMGHRAVKSGDAGAKTQAVQTLLALREDQQADFVAWLLADLGATHDAFRIASRLAARGYPGPYVFWHPSMRGALTDPGFPALATQLGLMDYWKATHTKPDACNDNGLSPPFCSMI
ncbi:MAG: TIR domain-containing protein [Alphaproteobacteria bacterium]|nr:TIR domain-containing protein [Alphaproteobacteria bacterium]MBU1516043.1 TIR domain-containing protein [Alphaproteobacteria bacterium]MBU2092742.1 TIR domain-containing protein [Alphaproteobacteria bacterium]MBU2153733.1 TIR domain-containing protein [Alphaproteobacteria bacterium]MBU2308361.1 TIR domain-containing protein [Alphaproteobacteria bacterium]